MSGITTLIIVGAVMFSVLGGITLLAYVYSLNNIKSKTVGDGQHGTARWMTKGEQRRAYQHIPFTPKKWREQAENGKTPTGEDGKVLPQGIVVGCTGNTTAMVDTGDVHVLMIGAAGVGNATYPQVIDEATLERLRSRKASRNTQTSTDRQSGIYLLKVPIICPSCGNSMHRLQDTRCKCTQKWVCNQCHIQIKKEDTELMEDITTLLNALIQRPEIIRTAQPSQAEPSIEQRRLDNEIARTLEGYDFDKDALREKLYQRASLGYLQIGDEAYVEHKLKNTLEQHDTLDSFDSELTNKTVKLIKLAENGSVSIILINDQEIRKEQTDHANSNPSDAT